MCFCAIFFDSFLEQLVFSFMGIWLCLYAGDSRWTRLLPLQFERAFVNLFVIFGSRLVLQILGFWYGIMGKIFCIVWSPWFNFLKWNLVEWCAEYNSLYYLFNCVQMINFFYETLSFNYNLRYMVKTVPSHPLRFPNSSGISESTEKSH